MEFEFREWPKIARFSREVIVTEKIDGTNACVGITESGDVLAGSRSGWLTGLDNFGFRAWVMEHADQLRALGPGRHFGEWWGQGIQRKYGLDHKRFSLFNVARWQDAPERPECCHVVPVIWRGPFDECEPGHLLSHLAQTGSVAAPGFKKPEGIVIFHVAGNVAFKKTIEKDDEPKGRGA